MSRLLRRSFLINANRSLKKATSLNLSLNLKKYSTVDTTDKPNFEGTSTETYNFKTETHKLLDIVANSLYSEKQVFLRELISNAADALEKLRYTSITQPDLNINQSSLQIDISFDKENNKLIIKDNGIGLTEQDLHEHLGTIAKSGSKAFVEKLSQQQDSNNSSSDKIIGQFGVGFYSGFMVGNKLEVFTRSSLDKSSQGYLWSSDGLGSYKISKMENLEYGTRIEISLKDGETKYLDSNLIKAIIKKYSNFVSFPIKLEGEVLNEVQPIWLKSASEIDDDMYKKFYHTVSDGFDDYQYKLLYKTDAPIAIKALLYLPKQSTDMLGNNTATQGVNLYSRQILIQPNCTQLLPTWLRFVKGVVDSEDIPLNLSREILQNGQALTKLKRVLTGKVVSWLKQEARRDAENFNLFYANFNRNFKEAVILEEHQEFKKDVVELLRFKSDKTNDNEFRTLDSYLENKVEGQKAIYYLNRKRNEMLSNPYYEPFQRAGIEVLAFDDIVDKALANAIPNYKDVPLVDIESKLASEHIQEFDANKPDENTKLKKEHLDDIVKFINEHLKVKLSLKDVTIGNVNTSYPLLIKGHEMDNDPYLRQFMMQSLPQGQSLPAIPVAVELNPYHPILQSLVTLLSKEDTLCAEVLEQLILNAKLTAGLLDDPKDALKNLNSLVLELVKSKELKE